jgi:hypothetical protein
MKGALASVQPSTKEVAKKVLDESPEIAPEEDS